MPGDSLPARNELNNATFKASNDSPGTDYGSEREETGKTSCYFASSKLDSVSGGCTPCSFQSCDRCCSSSKNSLSEFCVRHKNIRNLSKSEDCFKTGENNVNFVKNKIGAQSSNSSDKINRTNLLCSLYSSVNNLSSTSNDNRIERNREKFRRNKLVLVLKGVLKCSTIKKLKPKKTTKCLRTPDSKDTSRINEFDSGTTAGQNYASSFITDNQNIPENCHRTLDVKEPIRSAEFCPTYEIGKSPEENKYLKKEPLTTEECLSKLFYESLVNRFDHNSRCWRPKVVSAGEQHLKAEVLTETTNCRLSSHTFDNKCDISSKECPKYESESVEDNAVRYNNVDQESIIKLPTNQFDKSIFSKSNENFNSIPLTFIHETNDNKNISLGNFPHSQIAVADPICTNPKITDVSLDQEREKSSFETKIPHFPEQILNYLKSSSNDLSEFSEHSDSSTDVSTDDTDSTVDCEVPPIDDIYYDLHYNPYYHQQNFSLENIPDDQPINYPCPYFEETKKNIASADSHSQPDYSWENIKSDRWQRSNVKPGSELYRSQSQPQNLGSSHTGSDQPLDGNIPLHLFLSSSQPIQTYPPQRSDSFDNLACKQRNCGSLCSSFSSQLYTIEEEDIEAEDQIIDECNNIYNNINGDITPTCGSEAYFSNMNSSAESFSILNQIDMDIVNDMCSSDNSPPASFNYYSVEPRQEEEQQNSLLENITNDHEHVDHEQKITQFENSSNHIKKSLNMFNNLASSHRFSRSFPNLANCESDSDEFQVDTYSGMSSRFKYELNGFKDQKYRNFEDVEQKLSPGSYDADDYTAESKDVNNSEESSPYNSLSSNYSHVLSNEDSTTHGSLGSSDTGYFSSRLKVQSDLSCQFPYDNTRTFDSLTAHSIDSSFGAYSSDTSLDFDAFSKSSNMFKWNGSSSIADLSSLSKQMSSLEGTTDRRNCSLSTSDSGLNNRYLRMELALSPKTSYSAWTAETDEQKDIYPVANIASENSCFVFTPHAQTKRNSLSSHYTNQEVDSLSTDEESCDDLSSGSDPESPEDDVRSRSYLLGSLCDGGLPTIAEDAEEEEIETSGHWMFSADNTDTDSIIHLPFHKTFGLPSVNPFQNNKLSSSSSEEDLTMNENSIEKSLSNLSNKTKSAPINCDEKQILQLMNCAQTEENAMNSPEDPSFSETNSHSELTQYQTPDLSSDAKYSPSNSEDLFDFCSLEACETVSDSEDGIAFTSAEELTFNMSASSTPFAEDNSPIGDNLIAGVRCQDKHAQYSNDSDITTSHTSESSNQFISMNDDLINKEINVESVDVSSDKSTDIDYGCLTSTELFSHLNKKDYPVDSTELNCTPNNTAETGVSTSEPEPPIPSPVSKKKIKRFRKSAKLRPKHDHSHSAVISESTDSEEELDKYRLSKLTCAKDQDNAILMNDHINGEEPLKYTCLGIASQESNFSEALVSNSSSEGQPASLQERVVARTEAECKNNTFSLKYTLDAESLKKFETKLLSQSSPNFESNLRRPHSIGDLRPYSSDSDSEFEEQVHVVSHGKITTGGNCFVNKNANELLKSDIGFECIISTGLQKSRIVENKNILRSGVILRNKQVSQKPRRHQSMYNPEISTNYGDEWQPRVRNSGMHVTKIFGKGRQRPKPLSIDLAEEFLHQEEIDSHSANNKWTNIICDFNANAEIAVKHPNYKKSHGYSNMGVASATPKEIISGGNTCESSFNQHMMHKRSWPSAQTTNQPFPLPVAPQHCYDSQLFVRKRSSNTSWDVQSEGSVLSGEAIIHNQFINSQDNIRTNSRRSDVHNNLIPNCTETSDCNRVHTKMYGSQGEVYLSKNNMNSVAEVQSVDNRMKVAGKGVTFSPSVKEVNWRESYLQPDEGDFVYTQLEEKEVHKVKVISNSNFPPIKSKPVMTNIKSDSLNRISNPNYVNEYSKENVPINANGAKSNTLPTMSQNGVKERISSPPIWQRLKLVKIGAPKGPRPQIPPKPASLSSKSSQEKSLSESGIRSPEFNSAKKSSPRFFSWGSKREKRNNKNADSTSLHGLTPVHQENAPMNDNPYIDRNTNGNINTEISHPLKENYSSRNVNDDVVDNVNCNNETFSNSNLNGNVKGNDYQYNTDTINHLTNGNSHTTPKNIKSSPHSDCDEVMGNSKNSSGAKPPLPPYLSKHPNTLNKVKLFQARRQYFQRQNSLPANNLNKSPMQIIPQPQEVKEPDPLPAAPVSTSFNVPVKKQRGAAERLKDRFERFSKSARLERERLAKSTPDLSQYGPNLRSPSIPIDRPTNAKTMASPHLASDGVTSDSNPSECPLIREETEHTALPFKRGRVKPHLNEILNSEFARASLRSNSKTVGILETDLDTGASREVLSPKETNLDDLYQDIQTLLDSFPKYSSNSLGLPKERSKAKSLLQLDASNTEIQAMENSLTARAADENRAKSMEFLLDDDNRASIQVPENELQKEGDRKLSEAELRIRRSLQRLDLPDWMKNVQTPQQGFLLRRRDYSTGNAGWSAFSSKTGSMTSLGSSRPTTPNPKFSLTGRLSTRSYGGLTSPSPTASISPPPSDKDTTFSYPLSRWSTSRLNSGTTTPTGSISSQRTASYSRQPYLGWRSNTSLAALSGSQSSLVGGTYLTPAERLAISLLPKQKVSADTTEGVSCTEKVHDDVQNNSRVSDVHSSIKEVTSAIVHYCKDSPSPRSSPKLGGRPISPKRKVWVESSFVGTRPITSPESTMAVEPTRINGHQEEVLPTRPSHTPGEYLMAR